MVQIGDDDDAMEEDIGDIGCNEIPISNFKSNNIQKRE